MPRVSRKNLAPQKAEAVRIWSTAIYARLSNMNNGQETPESLETQVYMLRNFAEQQAELNLVQIYEDNGFTGTNFERPAFERLMMDVREKKIDCIVVKDLSRFGRNFVEAGYYIERLFPKMGIRFIAINDQYDSINPRSANSLLLPIKDMLNEYYSRDLSRKVRKVFEQKRKVGESYSVVPFGYQKNESNPGFYDLDEEYAPTVKGIFEWRISGKSLADIVKLLNEMGVPNPPERRRQLGYGKHGGKRTNTKWNYELVTKVLDNPVYTGDMVYNRKSYPDGYNKTPVINPREEWIIVPSVNPGIVTWDMFDAAFELREESKKHYKEEILPTVERNLKIPNPFKGYAFCSCCKTPLRRSFIGGDTDRPVLICMGRGCASHGRVEVSALENLIVNQIRLQIQASIDVEKLRKTVGSRDRFHKKEREIIEHLQTAERQTNTLKQRKQRIYEDFTEGAIDSEDCRILRNQIDQKLIVAELNRGEILQQLSALRAVYESTEELKAFQNGDLSAMTFNEDLLQEFIQRIEAGKDGSVHLVFRYQDQVKKRMEMEETT